MGVQQLRALRPMENEMPGLFVQPSQMVLASLPPRPPSSAAAATRTILPNVQERSLKDFRRAALRLPLIVSLRFCLFHSLFRNRLTAFIQLIVRTSNLRQRRARWCMADDHCSRRHCTVVYSFFDSTPNEQGLSSRSFCEGSFYQQRSTLVYKCSFSFSPQNLKDHMVRSIGLL